MKKGSHCPVFGSSSGLMCVRDGAGRDWVGMLLLRCDSKEQPFCMDLHGLPSWTGHGITGLPMCFFAC